MQRPFPKMVYRPAGERRTRLHPRLHPDNAGGGTRSDAVARAARRLATDATADAAPVLIGHRHSHRPRMLTGILDRAELDVPCARLNRLGGGGATEWQSRSMRAYQRWTVAADEIDRLGSRRQPNTRPAQQALGASGRGAPGKDIVSRVWRKVKSDFDAWNACSLTDELI